MTIGDLFTKLWNGVLALFGHKPPAPQPASPADPLAEVKLLMSQVSDLCDRISAALTRIAAAKSTEDSALAQANADNASLQQQLSDAETQLANLLEPIVQQAETISPPPPPALAIGTTALPDGVIGGAYSGQIAISGGVAPYHVSSIPASDNGLTVNSDGSVTGTPEAAADASFSITVTDSESPASSVTGTVTLNVPPAA
jgi:hypothetical protein